MRNRLPVLFCLSLLLGAAGVAEAGWEEGVAAFKAENYAQAAKEFQAVVEAQPDYAGGQFMLGQTYLRMNKPGEALAPLKKAYELDSANVGYQMLLGQAYLGAKRYGEAAQILKKIDDGSLNKQQRSAYHQMLALALEKSGRTTEAVAALKKAAEGNPNSSDAWYRYGAAAFNAGDTIAGVAALDKAAKLDPRDAEKRETVVKAQLRLGREARDLETKKGYYTHAAANGKELAALNGSFDNLLLLAEAQLGAKQFVEAEATLRKALAKNASNFYANYYLSQSLALQTKYTQADSAARLALKQTNRSNEQRLAWVEIGFVNEKLKNYDEAKLAYTNAGDNAAAQRVEENQKIAAENKEAEKVNSEIDRLDKERKELQKQLQKLPGGPPPRH